MQISSTSKASNTSNEEPTPQVIDQLDAAVSSATPATKNNNLKISFSVTKQKITKIEVKNKLIEKRDSFDDDEEEEEEDQNRKKQIFHLEDGVLVGHQVPAKKKEKLYVVPVLRHTNNAQIALLKKLAEEGIATERDLARLALLLESSSDEGAETQILKKDGGTIISTLDGGGTPTLAVPDDTDPDYECMPVGEFGLAFLRGCGWKNEKSLIGKTNAKAVPVKLNKPRPKGLGLGAVIASDGPEFKEKPTNGSRQDEADIKTLRKDAYIKCIEGMHRGIYGKVISIDAENSSVFVEVGLPSTARVGKTVRMSQFCVEVISGSEYRRKEREFLNAEDGKLRKRKHI